MTRFASASAMLVLGLVLSTAAVAQDRQDDQATVRFRTAGLTDARRAQTALDRLAAAAHRVCASEGVDDPMTQNADRACERQSMADAVAQLNEPAVSELAAREYNIHTDTRLAEADASR